MLIRKIIGRAVHCVALGCAGVVGLAAAAPAAKGSGVGGPSAGLRVPAKGSDTHQVYLRKGVRVNVTARGDGDTDIDLYVYSPEGKLVAKDDDTTDNCIVNITPEENGQYQLKIVNLGNVYNEYKLEIK